MWVGAAAFALPPGPPQLMACDEYRRTRIQQAMACTTAARQYQVWLWGTPTAAHHLSGATMSCGRLPLEHRRLPPAAGCPPRRLPPSSLQALSQLTRDWRCGAYVSMLLLPAGIYPALASAVMYAGCLASCATVEARYGVAAGALQHAAVPLTWQGLAGAPIWQHLGELALPFACTVLLPWAISFFLAALRLRLPPPPPPEEQRQQQQQRQLAAGARGVVAHGSGSGNGRSKVAGAGGKAGAEQHAGDLGGEEGGAPITPTSAASSSSGRQGSSPQGSSSPFDSPCRPPSTQNPLPDLRAGGADTAQLPDQATGPLGPAGDLLARPPRRPGGQALYRSPVSSDRRALLHVKLVGTDPGAEADFMEKLAGTLSDVLMPVQLAGAPQATPALQLVHVSAFSGALNAAAALACPWPGLAPCLGNTPPLPAAYTWAPPLPAPGHHPCVHLGTTPACTWAPPLRPLACTPLQAASSWWPCWRRKLRSSCRPSCCTPPCSSACQPTWSCARSSCCPQMR